MIYQGLPIEIGEFVVEVKEMMFYQYLPIKLKGHNPIIYEERLEPFRELINAAIDDFSLREGLLELKQSYVYLTVKHLFVTKGKNFNREGYHSDGFMTDDINYVWCNRGPTIFNSGEFYIPADDKGSLRQMEIQAMEENEVTYPDNTLLRLDDKSIHKVNQNIEQGMRCFVKISFSKDKYNLNGNSHNYGLNYKWEMKDRTVERNIPQQ